MCCTQDCRLLGRSTSQHLANPIIQCLWFKFQYVLLMCAICSSALWLVCSNLDVWRTFDKYPRFLRCASQTSVGIEMGWREVPADVLQGMVKSYVQFLILFHRKGHKLTGISTRLHHSFGGHFVLHDWVSGWPLVRVFTSLRGENPMPF